MQTTSPKVNRLTGKQMAQSLLESMTLRKLQLRAKWESYPNLPDRERMSWLLKAWEAELRPYQRKLVREKLKIPSRSNPSGEQLLSLSRNISDGQEEWKTYAGVVFVLGAGISSLSGLMLWSKLREAVIDAILLAVSRAMQLPSKFRPYVLKSIQSAAPEETFAILFATLQTSLHDALVGLNNAKPSINHRAIARLFWDGDIQDAITLNFDMLIELACYELGMWRILPIETPRRWDGETVLIQRYMPCGEKVPGAEITISLEEIEDGQIRMKPRKNIKLFYVSDTASTSLKILSALSKRGIPILHKPHGSSEPGREHTPITDYEGTGFHAFAPNYRNYLMRLMAANQLVIMGTSMKDPDHSSMICCIGSLLNVENPIKLSEDERELFIQIQKLKKQYKMPEDRAVNLVIQQNFTYTEHQKMIMNTVAQGSRANFTITQGESLFKEITHKLVWKSPSARQRSRVYQESLDRIFNWAKELVTDREKILNLIYALLLAAHRGDSLREDYDPDEFRQVLSSCLKKGVLNRWQYYHLTALSYRDELRDREAFRDFGEMAKSIKSRRLPAKLIELKEAVDSGHTEALKEYFEIPYNLKEFFQTWLMQNQKFLALVEQFRLQRNHKDIGWDKQEKELAQSLDVIQFYMDLSHAVKDLILNKFKKSGSKALQGLVEFSRSERFVNFSKQAMNFLEIRKKLPALELFQRNYKKGWRDSSKRIYEEKKRQIISLLNVTAYPTRKKTPAVIKLLENYERALEIGDIFKEVQIIGQLKEQRPFEELLQLYLRALQEGREKDSNRFFQILKTLFMTDAIRRQREAAGRGGDFIYVIEAYGLFFENAIVSNHLKLAETWLAEIEGRDGKGGLKGLLWLNDTHWLVRQLTSLKFYFLLKKAGIETAQIRDQILQEIESLYRQYSRHYQYGDESQKIMVVEVYYLTKLWQRGFKVDRKAREELQGYLDELLNNNICGVREIKNSIRSGLIHIIRDFFDLRLFSSDYPAYQDMRPDFLELVDRLWEPDRLNEEGVNQVLITRPNFFSLIASYFHLHTLEDSGREKAFESGKKGFWRAVETLKVISEKTGNAAEWTALLESGINKMIEMGREESFSKSFHYAEAAYEQAIELDTNTTHKARYLLRLAQFYTDVLEYDRIRQGVESKFRDSLLKKADSALSRVPETLKAGGGSLDAYPLPGLTSVPDKRVTYMFFRLNELLKKEKGYRST